LIIGRDPDQCNFVLEDASVSRKHVRIYKTAEGYVIKNLSTTNPAEVNEERIDEYILEEKDKIKIGNNYFLYTGVAKEDIIEPFEEEEIKEEEPTEETIFEENLEEIPSSLITEAAFILKVVSGPNAGSEFGMEKSKSYVIGKDTSADIIFTDLSVSKRNTKITIDNNKNVFVEDLGSKNGTYVNNNKIEEKTQITSSDLITVGTTTFLIVEKEAAQETIYSPAPTFEEKKKEKEEEVVAKKTIWQKQFIPTRHLILAGSFIVIIFVIFISFFGLFRAKDVEITKKESVDEIQKILKNYDTVQFSFNPSSASLLLVGHVLTFIDKHELFYDLKKLNFISKIEDTIIVDEGVWKDFNETLSDQEEFKSVSVHANNPGKFIIEGYVKTADDFQKLTDYINSNFPYLDKLENKVIIDQVLQSQISAKLKEKNLSGINFKLIAGELVLTGSYDKDQSRTLENLIEEFNKTPGIHVVNNLAITSSEASARIDLSKKYKITGTAKYDNKNFSIIANGKIINIGDLLDGMLITSITSNTILLEKDHIKYKINYSL
jgi:type III secretion system YscD/HrpQ family protein